MLKTTLSGMLLFVCFILQAQTEETPKTNFVVFIVDGITSTSEARNIDFEMRRHPEIQLSRMDVPTRRYYAIFDESSNFDKNWFVTKFKELNNYSIHCYFQELVELTNFVQLLKTPVRN